MYMSYVVNLYVCLSCMCIVCICPVFVLYVFVLEARKNGPMAELPFQVKESNKKNKKKKNFLFVNCSKFCPNLKVTGIFSSLKYYWDFVPCHFVLRLSLLPGFCPLRFCPRDFVHDDDWCSHCRLATVLTLSHTHMATVPTSSMLHNRFRF